MNKIDNILQKSGRDFVNAVYKLLFQREADDEGIQFYVSLIEKGTSKEEIITTLAHTSEAQEKGTTQKVLDELITLSQKQSKPVRDSSNVNSILALTGDEFITASFEKILKRRSDSDGFNYYLRRLESGFSKEEILSDFINSKEAKNKGVSAELLKKFPKKRGVFGKFLTQLQDRTSIVRSINSLKWSLETKKENKVLAADIRRMSNDLEDINALLRKGIELYELKGRQPKHSDNVFEATSIPVEYSLEHRNIENKVSNDGKWSSESILFNISTSYYWRAHAVGIIRVERELAKFFRKMGNTTFVGWDRERKCFREFDESTVDLILSEEWIKAYHEPDFKIEDLNKVIVNNSHHYISVGLDWDNAPVDEVGPILEEAGARSTFACHDIIPIEYPEYCLRKGYDQFFVKHFVYMAHYANRVLAFSQDSREKLHQLWLKYDLLTKLPKIDVVNLAAIDPGESLPSLGEYERNQLNDINATGEYVLFVSSFESRKNHKLLVNLWRELYSERGENCPQLVFVGMSGWGNTDLINQIERMDAHATGKIRWLQGVSDALLSHLYANSLFSVFPSYMEGWGLAATESLGWGKVCVISNQGGLMEATQWLVPAYHPLDFMAWKKEINRLLDDRTYLVSLEKRIQKQFVFRTWSDFAEEVYKLYLHANV